MPLLAEGIWTTLWLVGISLLCGLVLAVPFGVILASAAQGITLKIAKALVSAFSYVFRGTPMLVQLYIIYYGVGLQLGAVEGIRESVLWPILRQSWPWALLAFTLNTAAYTSEIVRGAIETTPKGEVEAAWAMGMSKGLIFRRIIMPSAIERALPAYGNEVIFMLHGSALASVVTLLDITGVARTLYAKYYEPFTPFIVAAVIYLLITLLITLLFRWLENRYTRHLIKH
ncbi:ABC transporter permease [Rappaport israeli]|uniref:ABC transporter permease n=1 Tax=Rappaport israeli TaxID=1839807 RepID=UPI000A3DF70D|nr:ABC transporter permease [Rappaport israeli]